jgi:hypothetical protein
MYDLLGCDIVTPYYLVGGYRLLGQLAVIICPEDSSSRCLRKTMLPSLLLVAMPSFTL